jgi:hypothetical protein
VKSSTTWVDDDCCRNRNSVASLTFCHMCASSPQDHACLENVSLSIPAGTFTVITGEVGSGKSSLLSTILGELVPQEGSCRLSPRLLDPGRIAYVGQNPDGAALRCRQGAAGEGWTGGWVASLQACTAQVFSIARLLLAEHSCQKQQHVHTEWSGRNQSCMHPCCVTHSNNTCAGDSWSNMTVIT